MGVVLYEMVTLQPPFRASSMAELYKTVLRGKYPPIPDFYSDDLAKFLKFILQVKPKKRPTTGQLL